MTSAEGNEEVKIMPEFGDFISVEQKRFGEPNEFYGHKVVDRLESNCYVDVPVQSPAEETIHSECVPVVSAICCGVCEKDVLKYRVEDVELNMKSKRFTFQSKLEVSEAQNKKMREALEEIADDTDADLNHGDMMLTASDALHHTTP